MKCAIGYFNSGWERHHEGRNSTCNPMFKTSPSSGWLGCQLKFTDNGAEAGDNRSWLLARFSEEIFQITISELEIYQPKISNTQKIPRICIPSLQSQHPPLSIAADDKLRESTIKIKPKKFGTCGSCVD